MSLSNRMPPMLGEVALWRKSFLPKRFKQDSAAMPRTTPEPQSEVGKNLRALIGDDSVNAWANRHKLSQTTVNRIVTGRMDPTVSTVEKIAEAVGLEPWRLLAPGLGMSQIRFDALDAYESNLVTSFRHLSDADRRQLLISVNARARLANDLPNSGESVSAGGGVPSTREQSNKSHESESSQWKQRTFGVPPPVVDHPDFPQQILGGPEKARRESGRKKGGKS